ncbi:MAG: hypothetical protein MUP16_05710 [Sedimentisphaerales bacterium]|nr:hypothetical protein [Sedimentisphaerales bacterium]
MANEIKVTAESGKPVDICLQNQAGKVVDTTVTPYHITNSWVDWDDDDYAEYVMALNDKGGDLHIGDFPDEITTDGKYTWIARQRASEEAQPARTDERVSIGQTNWSGTGEITEDQELLQKAAKMLLNKAIQTKLTGVIQYFDDDGVTEILTFTPTESDTQITRTPS